MAEERNDLEVGGEEQLQSKLTDKTIPENAAEPINRFYLEVILALFFAAVSGFFVWQSLKLWSRLRYAASSAGTFPFFLSSLIFLFSVFILGQIFYKEKKNRAVNGKKKGSLKAALAAETPFRVVLVALMAMIYVFVMPKIGYVISTFIFTMATMLYLNRGNIKFWRTLGSSIGVVAAYYIIFVIVFKVRLP